jgi:hypothetical protein
VAKSATGSVYDLGDTGFLTPLNLTLVATNTVTTSLISDANGMFPDFTLVDRTQCAFKSGTQVFILTTTTPIPGPASTVAGPAGPAGPATTDASLMTAGTLADARLPATAQAATLSSTYAPVSGSTKYVPSAEAVQVTAVTQATNIAVTLASNWGINAQGNGYHDPAGAPSGDGATLGFDTAGNLVLTKILAY